jgi:hypothetical protein
MICIENFGQQHHHQYKDDFYTYIVHSMPINHLVFETEQVSQADISPESNRTPFTHSITTILLLDVTIILWTL